MIDYTKDNAKRENLIQFIKVTQKLLDEDGLKYLSVRKIATASGFHNSTIYFYFQDLDELIMLASISRFQKYSEKLKALNETSDVYEKFYAIWDCFAESALKYSCVFHNFFFGKHSDNLPDFLNIYYDLFPEERNKFSADIEAMYFGKNYTERCRKILIPLIDDPRTRVTEENLDIITDITVSLTKDLLEKNAITPNVALKTFRNVCRKFCILLSTNLKFLCKNNSDKRKEERQQNILWSSLCLSSLIFAKTVSFLCSLFFPADHFSVLNDSLQR